MTKQMKQNLIKGKPLNFNAGIQKWYVNALVKMVDDLTKEVYEEIKPLYKEYKYQITFTEDASITSQTRMKINSLRDLFENKFKERGKIFAERMVKKTNKYSNVTFWGVINNMFKDNEEAKKANGFLLKGSLVSPDKEEVIKALIYENTSLITDTQSKYFGQITGAIMRSIAAGQGITHIEDELRKYKGMTKRRAKNIALDQTRKAYNDINARNMQDAGINKAEWLHSGGSQRPRTYHMTKWDGVSGLNDGRPNGLDGFIFSLNRLPVIDLKTGERGLPGQAPYCHCRMAPVIEFNLE